MKFQPDATQASSVTAYGPGWVTVNGEKVTSSVVISANGPRFPWNCANFEDLKNSHFERLAEMDVELVIFGSGERIRFVQPDLLQSLFARRIGVETMDTQAACRTYNFLAGEGRKVAAALLL
ncbi:MAG: Mth938-like domain-containing protein [Burkholderiales bacterium]|jgi:uncharacterized protein|nr:Mth938-like domain-containing protein [Burkholderiales bacterium]